MSFLPHTEPLSIEKRTKQHRATIRKMVWAKCLVGTLLMLIGLALPYLIDIIYIDYLGVSLAFCSIILIWQGIRTMRAYYVIHKEVVIKSSFGSKDIGFLKSMIAQEVSKNSNEQKKALWGLVICLIISVGAILAKAEVAIAASFIPLALILGIEFCFTLILLYVQGELKYWLDKY